MFNSKIHILDTVVEFNSKALHRLEATQQHILGVLKSSLSVIKSEYRLMQKDIKALNINVAVLSSSV